MKYLFCVLQGIFLSIGTEIGNRKLQKKHWIKKQVMSFLVLTMWLSNVTLENFFMIIFTFLKTLLSYKVDIIVTLLLNMTFICPTFYLKIKL